MKLQMLTNYLDSLAKIAGFALVFSFFSSLATPQLSLSFADEEIPEQPLARAPRTPLAIEGEFLVQYRDKQSFTALGAGKKPNFLKQLGNKVEIDTRPNPYNIALVKVNDQSAGNWENLAQELSADPDVAHVEPNYLYHQFENAPHDPMEHKLWYLNQVKAYQAWKQVNPSQEKDIIVAVIDSGVQVDHEDLEPHIWINKKEIPGNDIDDDANGYVDDVYGWNFVENNPLPLAYRTPYPVFSRDPETGWYRCSPHPTYTYFANHGTHVAGTIAALHDNNKGIKGITRKTKVMSIRALGGACGRGDTMAILKAMQYAIENGAKILNLSLGGYGSSNIMKRAVEMFTREGVLMIIAAGNDTNNNDGEERTFPASYPAEGIISVAASTPQDTLAEFSNYGLSTVDLAAPGVDIMSTVPVNGRGQQPHSSYDSFDGTSMATPIVSAAAALVWAQNPNLTNLQVKQKLMNGVDPVSTLSGKMVTGGRLNILKALQGADLVNYDVRPDNPPTRDQADRTPPTSDHGYGTSSVGGIRIFDQRSQKEEKMKW